MSPKLKTEMPVVIEVIRNGFMDKGGVKSLGVNGFARASGISPALITRYMQGKVGEPTTATLQKLAEYFGVSVAYLRGEENKYGFPYVDSSKDTRIDISDIYAKRHDIVTVAAEMAAMHDISKDTWTKYPFRIMQLSNKLAEVEQESLLKEICTLLESTGRESFFCFNKHEPEKTDEQKGFLKNNYKIKPFRFQFIDEHGEDCDSGFPECPKISKANPQCLVADEIDGEDIE